MGLPRRTRGLVFSLLTPPKGAKMPLLARLGLRLICICAPPPIQTNLLVCCAPSAKLVNHPKLGQTAHSGGGQQTKDGAKLPGRGGLRTIQANSRNFNNKFKIFQKQFKKFQEIQKIKEQIRKFMKIQKKSRKFKTKNENSITIKKFQQDFKENQESSRKFKKKQENSRTK